VPVLKRLIAEPGTRLVRISTRENSGNLAPGFIQALEGRYGGTRLGRQELDGELIEDREDALWKRDDLETCVIRFTGALRRIVVAVDPPSGAGASSCCGIVVAGIEAGGRGVVLADCSVEGKSPAGWAHAVARAYERFRADRVVAEVNQGGEMVAAMLKSVDANLPMTMVRATRGKFLRAEPVAALYEQGRVAHAGRFPELEDQMCDFGPDGLSSGRSPDRLDALVWALTALMLEGQGEPRVRGIWRPGSSRLRAFQGDLNRWCGRVFAHLLPFGFEAIQHMLWDGLLGRGVIDSDWGRLVHHHDLLSASHLTLLPSSWFHRVSQK
jgi:phage terminase large subunit-like protein